MIPLYFDYFATTPILPEVALSLYEDSLNPDMQASPSSKHYLGRLASDMLDEARTLLTTSLGLKPKTLVFTASATESIHLAILGAIEAYPRTQHTIVSWVHEHSASLGALQKAKHLYNAQIILLQTSCGRIDLTLLEDTLKKNNVFMLHFSLVHHELGIIQDIQGIQKLADSYGVLIHLDASQAIAKVPKLQLTDIDYITLPSHKCFGPQGIAALYISELRHRHIKGIMQGGGQQYALRPGTEPLLLIRAMSKTYTLLQTSTSLWHALVLKHHNKLLHALKCYGIEEHLRHDTQRVPYVFNIRIPSYAKDKWTSSVMCSQGSACGHKQGILSPALIELGLSSEIIAESYRISWCHLTTDSAMDQLLAVLKDIASGV